jgi:4-alpha-glucanotransferase
VLETHGLGRFRVTQKARPDDPASVYRSEHAAPADWVMVGTHDTASIWAVADGWFRDGEAAARAAYLATRLAPDDAARPALAAALQASPERLVAAQLADLLACRARHVVVFFADAFGLHDRYNRPGEVSPANWMLRLPADWRVRLRARLARDRALNLPMALATALRARGGPAALAAALDAEAAAWRAGTTPG